MKAQSDGAKAFDGLWALLKRSKQGDTVAFRYLVALLNGVIPEVAILSEEKRDIFEGVIRGENHFPVLRCADISKQQLWDRFQEGLPLGIPQPFKERGVARDALWKFILLQYHMVDFDRKAGNPRSEIERRICELPPLTKKTRREWATALSDKYFSEGARPRRLSKEMEKLVDAERGRRRRQRASIKRLDRRYPAVEPLATKFECRNRPRETLSERELAKLKIKNMGVTLGDQRNGLADRISDRLKSILKE